MEIPKYVTYDNFAHVYDKYLARNSLKIVPVLEELSLDNLEEGARVLDLCCGSGRIAQRLSEMGFQVTGIDSSAEMLVLARKNAESVDFKLDDARTFVFGNVFDLIIAMSDSLNHIMKEEELQLVFQNVHNALHVNGTFIFDMTMETGYQKNWVGYQSNIIEDDFVSAIACSYDTEEKLGKFHTTIFNKEEEWRRTDVTLFQRCYSEEQIIYNLEAVGFGDIEVFDAKKDFNLKMEGKNIFSAKKYEIE